MKSEPGAVATGLCDPRARHVYDERPGRYRSRF